MFRLTRHFSLMSAITMAAITAALVAGYHWVETRNLYAHATERNVAIAKLISTMVWSDHLTELEAAAHEAPGQLAKRPETQRLDLHLRRPTQDLGVLKVKIYLPSGVTIYSSDHAQIGESKADSAGFQRVLGGHVPTSRITFRQHFQGTDGQVLRRWIAETYVPIVTEAAVVGVVEVYGDITAFTAGIRRATWTVAAIGVLMLGLLYVLLLLIVRRADLVMRSQYKQLATFSGALERGVAERTRSLLAQQDVIGWITRSDQFRKGTVTEAAGGLMRAAAGVLGVDRAAVWLVDETGGRFERVAQYAASRAETHARDSVPIEEVASLLAALEREECLTVLDPRADPRTAMLADAHPPGAAVSLLAAAVRHKGHRVGIILLERVGRLDPWLAEQQLFAVSLADLFELVLERRDREAIEERLTAAHASLETANRAKSLFLANMSHEIRTPMNGVIGMTDLLLRTDLGSRERRLAGTIRSSAESLLGIIDDVLDIARIESGKLTLDPHPLDPREVVEASVEPLAEDAASKDVALTLYVADDVPAAFVCDRGRLRQILTNIVGNAVKFTSRGEVRVRMAAEPDGERHATLLITVEDTGTGIAPAALDRLFQPFEQADASITRRFGGTGLGLSISRHLVEAMGGSIALQSAPGEGTRVEIRIPGELGPEAARRDTTVAACLAGAQVLVVDALSTNREIVAAHLGARGARAVAVATAEAALAAVATAIEERRPFALAIVDMALAGTSGLDLGARLVDRAGDTPPRLVLLTPVSWAGDARTAHAHGFEAILTKPIRRDELLETAQRLLNGPAADASPEGRTATPARRPCSTGVRVLVAEDNPVNLEVARAQLETLGCTVTAVVDGLEASTVFERERFDLVLLDCQMPRMDGLTAARRMRAIEEQAGRRQTPIVAVTANAFEADRQACLAAGMDDYLGKPFGFAALEAVVQRWTRPGIGEEDAPRRSAPAPERGASVVDLDRTVAQPAMPLQATPTLDRPLVERMRASHAHLLGRLVSTYLEYAPGALASLGDAVRRGDKPAVSRAAHSLKSSSANVGGQRLAELCRLLEAHLRHPDAGVDETSRRLADDIEAEYERLAVALSTIRQDIDSAASGLRLASEAATVGGR